MMRQSKNNTLNPALTELIKLLAQVAVEDYLKELQTEEWAKEKGFVE